MVPEVGIVTLKPQEAEISTVLPGRVVAYQVSEVRPQVTGILLKRDFVEGAEVKEGDLLYEIDPVQYKAALASAEASVQRAEATLVSVRLKAARKTQLLQTNAASQQDVDDAVAAYKQGEADLHAAQANRDTAAISLDRTRVTASISGRIGKSTITPGALVTASQATAMTTIQQLDPVYVDLDQSTSEMERLRSEIASGQLKRPAGGVQVELLMESGKVYGHKGKYGFTDTSVNESTGSVSSRAVFANPERLLLPGMYVRTRRRRRRHGRDPGAAAGGLAQPAGAGGGDVRRQGRQDRAADAGSRRSGRRQLARSRRRQGRRSPGRRRNAKGASRRARQDRRDHG